MKIFNIMLSRDLGGIQQSFLDYADIIEAAGFQHFSIITKKSNIKSFVKNNYFEVNNYFSWDLSSVFQLTNLINQNNPEIIIAHGNRAIKFAILARKLSKNNPIIIGVAHNYSFKKLIKCDYIFSITEYMKKYLVSKNYPEEKIFVMPNVINSLNYDFSEKNYFGKTITIGVLARFVKKKGIDVAINSIKVMLEMGLDVKLIIGGSGEEEEFLKNLTKTLNLENKIKFIGWVKDKKEFFSKIDIFCLPSIEEPFGIIILEAMLSKTPIISTRSEGPKEILRNNEDAIIVEIESPKAIADAAQIIINDEKLRKEMVEKAYLRLMENYDIKSGTKIFTNHLKKIISNAV